MKFHIDEFYWEAVDILKKIRLEHVPCSSIKRDLTKDILVPKVQALLNSIGCDKAVVFTNRKFILETFFGLGIIQFEFKKNTVFDCPIICELNITYPIKIKKKCFGSTIYTNKETLHLKYNNLLNKVCWCKEFSDIEITEEEFNYNIHLISKLYIDIKVNSK